MDEKVIIINNAKSMSNEFDSNLNVQEDVDLLVSLTVEMKNLHDYILNLGVWMKGNKSILLCVW